MQVHYSNVRQKGPSSSGEKRVVHSCPSRASTNLCGFRSPLQYVYITSSINTTTCQRFTRRSLRQGIPVLAASTRVRYECLQTAQKLGLGT